MGFDSKGSGGRDCAEQKSSLLDTNFSAGYKAKNNGSSFSSNFECAIENTYICSCIVLSAYVIVISCTQECTVASHSFAYADSYSCFQCSNTLAGADSAAGSWATVSPGRMQVCRAPFNPAGMIRRFVDVGFAFLTSAAAPAPILFVCVVC